MFTSSKLDLIKILLSEYDYIGNKEFIFSLSSINNEDSESKPNNEIYKKIILLLQNEFEFIKKENDFLSRFILFISYKHFLNNHEENDVLLNYIPNDDKNYVTLKDWVKTEIEISIDNLKFDENITDEILDVLVLSLLTKGEITYKSLEKNESYSLRSFIDKIRDIPEDLIKITNFYQLTDKIQNKFIRELNKISIKNFYEEKKEKLNELYKDIKKISWILLILITISTIPWIFSLDKNSKEVMLFLVTVPTVFFCIFFFLVLMRISEVFLLKNSYSNKKLKEQLDSINFTLFRQKRFLSISEFIEENLKIFENKLHKEEFQNKQIVVLEKYPIIKKVLENPKILSEN